MVTKKLFHDLFLDIIILLSSFGGPLDVSELGQVT